MEVEEHVVLPDDSEFDISKACEFSKEPRICIRYECVPMRFIKHVYKIKTYTQDSKFYERRIPKSDFLNSSYDGSFIVGLLKLRYIHSLSVERIINYFESHGFNLNKPTAHKLIECASVLFENLYQCIRQTVIKDSYISADETYYRILVPENNTNGMGVKKGYLWVIVGMKSRITYLIYDNGSRLEEEILKDLGNYMEIIHSGVYVSYWNLGGNDYPDIISIGCIQHMKRKLLNCNENDPAAKEFYSTMNQLFHEDHNHILGVADWTMENNLEYCRLYAPDILGELKDKMDEFEKLGNLLFYSDLQKLSTIYEKNGTHWLISSTTGIQKLENNTVFYNSYLSISRRNSLSIGSHNGADTIALSCKM